MFLFLLSLFFQQATMAQTNELPNWDFGKDGLVVKHEASQFVMKTRFRIQGRAAYEDYDSDNKSKTDLANMSIHRMRLSFDGHALDPRFIYKFQLSFSRYDIDIDNSAYPGFLRDAAIGWKLSDNSTFWFGQLKLPGNRQRVMSSGNLELVERSILNGAINIDRDVGLQWHNRFFADSTPLWLKLAISNGEGRNNNNRNNSMSYTARVEWLPLGAFKDGGDYFEGDLAHEETPKISIGAVYNKNQKASRIGGQYGKPLSDGTNPYFASMETYLADFMLKYKGWSLTSEFAQRNTDDNPIVPLTATTNGAIYKGNGFTTQLSYVFENNFSPIFRYTQLFPDKSIRSIENEKTQYTVGLTRYLNGHRIKLQGDVTLEEEKKISGVDYQNWYARLQIEFGI